MTCLFFCIFRVSKKGYMKNILEKSALFFGAINEYVGRGVAWLTSALVLLFCYDVLMRYLFNTTSVWIGELEWHLYALVFLLGAGYTLKHDKHVRVDVFYNNFSPSRKAWVNLIGALIFLIPWCIMIIYQSYFYGYTSFSMGEGSPNPGGLPFRFLIKFSITLGFFFLLLQALALVFESLLVILKK